MKSFNSFWKSQSSEKSMSDEEVIQILQSKGHSSARAKEIIEEAKNSSNPDYILDYYGVKKSEERTEKPGESIHSQKWDDCVADVKASGTGKNAYAVCTAQLGDEAFKSQYHKTAVVGHEMSKAIRHLKKFGIEGAGPIPKSLLADQDLEEGTTKSFHDVWKDATRGVHSSWYKGYQIDEYVLVTGERFYITMNNRFENMSEAKKAIDSFLLSKSVVTDTDKKIEAVAEEGKEDGEDKEVLADKIEDLQSNKQKATIEEREKSFNAYWKEKNDKKEDDSHVATEEERKKDPYLSADSRVYPKKK